MDIQTLVEEVDGEFAHEPFPCRKCAMRFERNCDRNHHESRHISGHWYFSRSRYFCGHCGKCFPQAPTLHRHMKTHIGKKPYKCEKCGKPFSDSNSLARHLRSNSHRKFEKEGDFSESQVLTTSPSQRQLGVSLHSELDPGTSLRRSPEQYQQTHLSGPSQGDGHEQGQHTKAPFSNDTQPTVSGSSSILLASNIFAASRTALEELWTVAIRPDALADSSITLSPTTQKLLSDITDQLTHDERLLFCCIKWEFDANEAGNQMTIELATSQLAQIKKLATAPISEKYSHSMDIAQTLLQIMGPFHYTDRVHYICNQVYDFCFACLKHPKFDLRNHLLRYWYLQKRGWLDVFYSIPYLERMTANSEHLVTSDHFHRALRLATVIYCGLDLPASQAPNQSLQSVIDCLQRLSEWAALRDLSTEEDFSPSLNKYLGNLRRQLSSRVVPSDIKHTTNERLRLSGGSDVNSDEEEINPSLDYLKSLDILDQRNLDLLIEVKG
ncbi:hypothetical protein BKA65DRAFT_554017 [Rhexocercosporidium sp. MPI-PUGE-AT-0058]|nr:hypothetical protein BKA65DRAFT_554017 [Rhexocercosporidium sp. MPI-PUGE-AT-0058]